MADSGFGKAVAEVYRELKKQIESRPINTSEAKTTGGVDREVREQVIADLEGLAKRHEGSSRVYVIGPNVTRPLGFCYLPALEGRP